MVESRGTGRKFFRDWMALETNPARAGPKKLFARAAKRKNLSSVCHSLTQVSRTAASAKPEGSRRQINGLYFSRHKIIDRRRFRISAGVLGDERNSLVHRRRESLSLGTTSLESPSARASHDLNVDNEMSGLAVSGFSVSVSCARALRFQ